MARVPLALLDVAAGRPSSDPGDPRELLDAAAAHGLTGLLWSSVLDGDVPVLREPALELAAADIETRERHTRVSRTLVDVTQLLDGRGIETATFKGVIAERRWYGRTGERPCSDVDLLLAPDCATRIGEAVDLLDRRYRRRAGLERRVQMGLQQAATIDFGGVTVDLHVEVPKFGIPSRGTTEVWQRVETHRLGDGTEVRALDAEAHLFVFLAGLVKDRFARLLTYSDVRRVAATDDLDWDCVERLAALDSLDQPLLRSLHTVAATLGLASLGPWPALRAPSLPWAVLCRRGTRLAGSRPRPRRLLLMPLVIPGRRVEVARSLVRRVRPPREIAQDLYPDGASSPVARLRKDRVTAAAPAPAPATTRPTVAVVIPTFQRRDLVVEAVRSVLDQQVPADEVIVVDDGSTDGTADALHAAFGTAVRVIQQPNGGPSAARNEGIRHARSDIVAFQDSDNRWQPHHLALVHELLARHPAAVLVATSDGYEFGDETAADARRRDLAEALLLEAVDLAFLSTVACPRSIVTEVGGFDEDLRFGEDVDLFIRLALHGPFVTARASTLERETTAESLEASGWAQGRYAHYLTRSAANALVEIGRPSAVVTDGALRAAMARRAIAAILTRLEAGADATELHPCIEEAIRWQPGFATGPWWIVRQVEAAHRGRDADDLRSEMLTTVAAAWPSARANP